MAILREQYRYRTFSGQIGRDFMKWLERQAERAETNEDLARRFVFECRRRQIILPAITTMERLCADSLVAAERQTESRIADRLDDVARQALTNCLTR